MSDEDVTLKVKIEPEIDQEKLAEEVSDGIAKGMKRAPKLPSNATEAAWAREGAAIIGERSHTKNQVEEAMRLGQAAEAARKAAAEKAEKKRVEEENKKYQKEFKKQYKEEQTEKKKTEAQEKADKKEQARKEKAQKKADAADAAAAAAAEKAAKKKDVADEKRAYADALDKAAREERRLNEVFGANDTSRKAGKLLREASKYGALGDEYDGVADEVSDLHRGSMRRNRLFPGLSALAATHGIGPRGLRAMQFAVSPLALLGGVASGNPLLGAAGGFGTGLQLSSLLGGAAGLGAVATGGLALGFAGVGLSGASAMYGAYRAYGATERSIALRGRTGANYDPSHGPRQAGRFQEALYQAALGQRFMSADDYLAFASQMNSGGWKSTGRGLDAIKAGAPLVASDLGITGSTLDALEQQRSRGGGLNRYRSALSDPMAAQFFAPNMARSLIGAGFIGPEVGAAMGNIAKLGQTAFGMGTSLDSVSFIRAMEADGQRIGQLQSERVNTGLAQSVMAGAAQGIGGFANPELGVMMLQAYGGLDLSGSRGASMDQLNEAEARLGREGVTAEGTERLRGYIRQKAGNDPRLIGRYAREVLGGLGVPMDMNLANEFMNGSESSKQYITDRIRARQSMQNYAPGDYAGGVTPGTTRAAIARESTEVANSGNMMPLKQAVENFKSGMTNVASSLDAIANALSTVTNWTAGQVGATVPQ